MLNFLKSPDYSLKFNIPYRTGNPFSIQTPESLKSLKPSEFNTRLTDSQLKEEQDTHSTSQSKRLKHCPVWWLLKTPSSVSPTAVLKEVSKSIQRCFPRDNYRKSPETTHWLWLRSNPSAPASTSRAQIWEQEREKWPWSWTLIRTSMVTETSTAPPSPPARPSPTWVFAVEPNPLVSVSTTALRRSFPTAFKLKSLVSPQDWRARSSYCRVSVTLVTGWQNSSSNRAPS